MTIKDGNVKAHIAPETYDKDPNMRGRLHESLNNRFLGAQLISHKPYNLSESHLQRLHPDGRSDTTYSLKPLIPCV